MTVQAKLRAEQRTERGKGAARRLRRDGRIPAVVYGKGLEPIHLTADYGEVDSLFQNISVENTLVDLEVPGVDEELRTLIREIQVHPFRSEILHIDFLRIQEGVAVELEVPVRLVGTPTGVKDDGGVLEQTINELPIKCVPSLIPEVIEVDVTGLEIGDSLHVEHLAVGEGVEVLLDPERTVCSVQAPSLALEPELEVEEEAEVLVVGEEELEEEADAAAEGDEEEGEDAEE